MTAQPKAQTNGEAVKLPQLPTNDFQAEAQFWQIKYIELLAHSNQVIGMLSRGAVMTAIAQRQEQQHGAQAG